MKYMVVNRSFTYILQDVPFYHPLQIHIKYMYLSIYKSMILSPRVTFNLKMSNLSHLTCLASHLSWEDSSKRSQFISMPLVNKFRKQLEVHVQFLGKCLWKCELLQCE